MGIHTILDLRDASPKEIRTQFGVVVERTCNELRGISCLELEDIAPAKKQIMSSRSFGAPVESIEELGEAISTYVARAGEKLRQQESVAAAVHVFIKTNRFSENQKQYNGDLLVPLAGPSDDTLVLIRAALSGLKTIFKQGYRYTKAGIMLSLLTDKSEIQATLFDNPEVGARSTRLMAAMDAVNNQYGRDTLRSGSSGIEHRWATRAENRSPRYTTRWDELPEVR